MLSKVEKINTLQTCAWCSGAGRYELAPGHLISCLVCGGKGTVSIRATGSKCQVCEGRGRRNPLNPCMACAGTGWAEAVGQR